MYIRDAPLDIKGVTKLGAWQFFVSPEPSSVRNYVITHSVRSMQYVCMCMYVVFCKIDHCIHSHWCIVMGLGHNDPWVESHMWPQQTRGQRSSRGQGSSRGQWPLVQVFGKKGQCIHILWCIFKSNITMIAKVCDRESRRDTWFENRLVFFFFLIFLSSSSKIFFPFLCEPNYFFHDLGESFFFCLPPQQIFFPPPWRFIFFYLQMQVIFVYVYKCKSIFVTCTSVPQFLLICIVILFKNKLTFKIKHL